jgi:hypothetical protein
MSASYFVRTPYAISLTNFHPSTRIKNAPDNRSTPNIKYPIASHGTQIAVGDPNTLIHWVNSQIPREAKATRRKTAVPTSIWTRNRAKNRIEGGKMSPMGGSYSIQAAMQPFDVVDDPRELD